MLPVRMLLRFVARLAAKRRSPGHDAASRESSLPPGRTAMLRAAGSLLRITLVGECVVCGGGGLERRWTPTTRLARLCAIPRASSPRPHMQRTFVLFALSATLGCSRLGLEHDTSGVDAVGLDAAPGSDGVDASGGLVLGDRDASTPPSDAAPGSDAAPTPDASWPPASDIPTPPRTDDLDRLYCGLDNGQLVAAALRAGACLDVVPAGILDEAARGFVFGEMMTASYYPVTFGNCELLSCLARAADCAAAEACNEARFGEPCDNFQRRCDGDVLEACTWVGDEYRYLDAQNCTRLGATCVEDDIDGRPSARCEGAPPTGDCGFYGACDGDIARRCTDPFGDGDGASFDIDCAQIVEGGTCVETAVGGEAPGPTCLPADFECTPSFAEGFSCLDDSRMSICLYGRVLELDCRDYGYAGCGDGDAFFSTRCVE